MTEFDDLKAEVAALRAEVIEWKSRCVEAMGVASRSQGFGEGVAGTQKILNESFDRRLSALECRPLSPRVRQLVGQMDDKELHKKVRDAIFLEALGSWEESCTFEELSADGRQVYEGYATAAMEVYRDELKKLRAQAHEMAAKIEAATTTELAKANDELRTMVRHAKAMEHAGTLAIAALRGVADNEALTADQHASVAAAILAMLDAKPRWQSKGAASA